LLAQSSSFTNRIIIAFRGTTTLNDWKTDFTATLTEIDNPLADKDKFQRKQLGIHLGFARYLFAGDGGTQKKHGKLGPDYDPESTKGSKFNAIVGHVRRLLAENPGCHIYCIGHSLGGALATLTAFFLATMPEVPAPVSCVRDE
jgi:predicted lipase